MDVYQKSKNCYACRVYAVVDCIDIKLKHVKLLDVRLILLFNFKPFAYTAHYNITECN